MLLQSLLLIATLTIIGGAILTSSLVTAKAAFHAKVLRASDSAMTDATAAFVTWAQNNVRQNGIEQLPVWASAPQSMPAVPVCAVSVTPNTSRNAVDICKLYETINWNITGYTGSKGAANLSSSSSLATGISSSQDEQRVSATISVAITDPLQSTQYAYRSRLITARIFHSAPYVALTASKDAGSQNGSISAAEGDSAGNRPQIQNAVGTAISLSPNASTPATYVNTLITTTADCVNTAGNTAPDALADNKNVVFSFLRNYGNLAWIYETPCKPLQRINPSTAPAGYQSPIDNVYRSQAATDVEWVKNDDDHSSFPR